VTTVVLPRGPGNPTVAVRAAPVARKITLAEKTASDGFQVVALPNKIR